MDDIRQLLYRDRLKLIQPLEVCDVGRNVRPKQFHECVEFFLLLLPTPPGFDTERQEDAPDDDNDL